MVGRQQEQEVVKDENKKNPETIQNFEFKSVEKDMYLGMQISQDGPRASCTNNIDIKRSKVALKVQVIVRLLKDKRIRRMGWMDVSCDWTATGHRAAGAGVWH